jgi:hypothetical protein
MKKISILFLTILFLAACSKTNNWFYGSWVVDEKTTYENAQDKSNNSLANLAVNSIKNYIISIDDHSIIFTMNEKKKEMKYARVNNKDGSVLLDTNQKDLILGKDNKGIFILGEQYIKIGNEKKVTDKYKLYLKPSNN